MNITKTEVSSLQSMSLHLQSPVDPHEAFKHHVDQFLLKLEDEPSLTSFNPKIKEFRGRVKVLDLATLDPALKQKNFNLLCHFTVYVTGPCIAFYHGYESIQNDIVLLDKEFRAILQSYFTNEDIDQYIDKISLGNLRGQKKVIKVTEIANQNTAEMQTHCTLLRNQAALLQETLVEQEKFLKINLAQVYEGRVKIEENLQSSLKILANRLQTVSVASLQNSQHLSQQLEKIVEGEESFNEIQNKTHELLKRI